MAAISINRAWDETNALLRREGALLIPVALALVALPGVLLDLVRPPMVASDTAAMLTPATMLANVAGLLVTLFASLVLTLLALRPGISVAEAMRAALGRVAIAIGSSMLLGLCLALLIVPALPVLTGGQAAVQRLNPALALLLLVYLCAVLLALFYGLARLLLLNTVVAVEGRGVFASVARSWALTRGVVWRLLSFMAMFLAASMIAGFAVTVAGGTVLLGLGRLIGDPALGLLLLNIVRGLVNAAFVTWLYLMLASIYRQVAAGSSSGI